jgi:hypothetical protein
MQIVSKSGSYNVLEISGPVQALVYLQGVEELHAHTWSVIGGTKTGLYCQATVWRTCDLAVPRTFEGFWVSLEIKTNELFWRKVEFCANLEQMLKRTATDLNRQPTSSQQSLT